MPKSKNRELYEAIREAERLHQFPEVRALLIESLKRVAGRHIWTYQYRSTNLIFEEIWKAWREQFGGLNRNPWEYPKMMMREIFNEMLEFLELEDIVQLRRVPWHGTIYEAMKIPEGDRRVESQKKLFKPPVGRAIMPILSVTADPDDINRLEKALIEILQGDPSPEALEEYAEARAGLNIDFMPRSLPIYKGRS